jgi:hypothetical protein
MVRYCAAAAAATDLNHSRRRSRDRIGVEIICVSRFAYGDGAGLVWRSTIEPNALTNLDVHGGWVSLWSKPVHAARLERTPAQPQSKILPPRVRVRGGATPCCDTGQINFAVQRRPGLLVRPFRLFATNSLALNRAIWQASRGPITVLGKSRDHVPPVVARRDAAD